MSDNETDRTAESLRDSYVAIREPMLRLIFTEHMHDDFVVYADANGVPLLKGDHPSKIRTLYVHPVFGDKILELYPQSHERVPGAAPMFMHVHAQGRLHLDA